MPKCKKKNTKKGANTQPYDVQAAPLAATRDKSQETESTSGETTGQGHQVASFSCDKCSKSTEHLLQCEYCAAWFCNVCCKIIHGGLLNSLGDYKNLH